MFQLNVGADDQGNYTLNIRHFLLPENASE
jgi:hypothetical protein